MFGSLLYENVFSLCIEKQSQWGMETSLICRTKYLGKRCKREKGVSKLERILGLPPIFFHLAHTDSSMEPGKDHMEIPNSHSDAESCRKRPSGLCGGTQTWGSPLKQKGEELFWSWAPHSEMSFHSRLLNLSTVDLLGHILFLCLHV